MTGGVPAGDLLVYGTCVAISHRNTDVRGALLRGAPGSGKSDLALRFISLFGSEGSSMGLAHLVSDDQVLLSRKGDKVLARPPGAIAGKLEVRGVGIVDVNYCAQATLAFMVDLVGSDEVPRMPEDPLPCEEVLGICVPVLKLDPFELSSPVKLKLALTGKP